MNLTEHYYIKVLLSLYSGSGMCEWFGIIMGGKPINAAAR